MLKKKLTAVFILFLALCVHSAAVFGQETSGFTLGTRAAFNTDRMDETFQQYDLFGTFPLPRAYEWESGWRIESLADLTLSVLNGEGETGGTIAVGPDLFLLCPKRWIALNMGGGFGFYDDHKFGEYDLGGPLFFHFQAGATVFLHPSLSVGYRYHHKSNGSIYDKNPSFNMHQFEMRFWF